MDELGEERLLSSSKGEYDLEENVLRPKTLDEYVGQDKVKEERASGFDKTDSAFCDALLCGHILIHTLVEGILHRRRDEFHRTRSAANLDSVTLFFEIFDVPPQRHTRHVRKALLELFQRNKRLFGEKLFDYRSTLGIHVFHPFVYGFVASVKP